MTKDSSSDDNAGGGSSSVSGENTTYANYPLEGIAHPHPHDVLCGRGGGTNAHIGNSHWRMLVAANKELYVTLPKKQKMLLSKSIVNAVRSQNPPGRFLQKDSKTDTWCDVGDHRATEKTSQALREGAPEIRSKIKDPKDATTETTTSSTSKKDFVPEETTTKSSSSSPPPTTPTATTKSASTSPVPLATTSSTATIPSSGAGESKHDNTNKEDSSAATTNGTATAPLAVEAASNSLYPLQQKEALPLQKVPPHENSTTNTNSNSATNIVMPTPRQPTTAQSHAHASSSHDSNSGAQYPNAASNTFPLHAPYDSEYRTDPYQTSDFSNQAMYQEQQHQQQQNQFHHHHPMAQHQQQPTGGAFYAASSSPHGNSNNNNNLAPLPPQQQQQQQQHHTPSFDDEIPQTTLDDHPELSFGSIHMSDAEQARLMANHSIGSAVHMADATPAAYHNHAYHNHAATTTSTARTNDSSGLAHSRDRHSPERQQNRSQQTETNHPPIDTIVAPVDGGLEPQGLSFGTMMSIGTAPSKLEDAGFSLGSTMSYVPTAVDGGLEGVGFSFGTLSLDPNDQHDIVKELTAELDDPNAPLQQPIFKQTKSRGKMITQADIDSDDEEDDDNAAAASSARKSAEWEKLKASVAAQQYMPEQMYNVPPPSLFQQHSGPGNNNNNSQFMMMQQQHQQHQQHQAHQQQHHHHHVQQQQIRQQQQQMRQQQMQHYQQQRMHFTQQQQQQQQQQMQQYQQQQAQMGPNPGYPPIQNMRISQNAYDRDMSHMSPWNEQVGDAASGGAAGIAVMGVGLDHDLSGQVMPIPQHMMQHNGGGGSHGMPPPAPPVLRKADSDEWPDDPLDHEMPPPMAPPPVLRKAESDEWPSGDPFEIAVASVAATTPTTTTPDDYRQYNQTAARR